jgi:hypothetical protein
VEGSTLTLLGRVSDGGSSSVIVLVVVLVDVLGLVLGWNESDLCLPPLVRSPDPPRQMASMRLDETLVAHFQAV